VVCLLSFAMCIGYSVTSLTFLADRSALVDSGEHMTQISNAFQKEFPNNSDIVVLVDGGKNEEREQFVDELAKRLAKHPELYPDIFVKVELPFLKSHALSYLEANDLGKLVASLKDAKGMMNALNDQAGIGSMLSHSSKDLETMLPILNEIIGQFLKSLQTRGRYRYDSPWEKAFFESASEASDASQNDVMKEAGKTSFYNTVARGEKHLVLVKPGEDTGASIDFLRKEIKKVKPNYPTLEVGVTGELVLDQDEMESSTNDSAQATVWSMILVMIAFLFSFRYLSRPVMALVALTISVGWTLGFTTLAIGHLNLLTVTFATMLIGLGADFGIHFIYGYEEQREAGLDPLEAMQETMTTAGAENFTGAVTTAIAFWAIRFTDFRGVAELGLIAGTGVMFAFFAMATFLIACIFLQEKRPKKGVPISAAIQQEHYAPYWGQIVGWAESKYLAHPWWVIGLCSALTLWCLSIAPQVKFDYNLLNLQSKILPSVQTELKLISADSHGVLFAVATADSLEDAQRKSERFSKLHSVNRVESVLPLIPQDFKNKLASLKEIEAVMASIPLPAKDGPAGSGTGQGLRKMGDGFLQLKDSFDKSYEELSTSPDPEIRRQAKRFKELLGKLFRTLEKMGPGPISDGVTAFQKNLFGDLHDMLDFLKSQRAEPQVTLDQLPKQIKERSVGLTGKILLRIYPQGNPWDRDFLTIFVHDIQSVDKDTIGTPVMVYYHTEALKRAYEVSGWYALFAISIVLLIHFQQLRNTLLALLPKVIGVIWMVGAMAYYQIDFNPANFMALPLILGIGLIFGVHVVHRLLHDPNAGIFTHSTGPAIALSALTTIFGFGTLLMAQHQGIASLGFLMSFGVAANLITSLVLLPAVVRVLPPAKAH
jgi:hopanoid biosynthesis associated RND transporter like protein HpnN